MASHNFLLSFHFFRTEANAELGPKKEEISQKRTLNAASVGKRNIFQEEVSYMPVRTYITVIALRFRQWFPITS